jgi:AcrR family transcriptional regulator
MTYSHDMAERKMNPLAATKRRTSPGPAEPGRRERRRNEIRERIFGAALRLFAERGYTETTVEDITEAADVGKGTFFNYFPTKEHVLATYGDERVATVERALEKARAGKGPVLEVLRDLATSVAGQSSASPALLRSIFAANLSNAPIRSEFQKRMQRARHLMAELFVLAQDRGEVRRDRSAANMARMTHIIFMGVTIAWAVNPDSSLQKSAEEVWDSILPSLRAEKSRREKSRA